MRLVAVVDHDGNALTFAATDDEGKAIATGHLEPVSVPDPQPGDRLAVAFVVDHLPEG